MRLQKMKYSDIVTHMFRRDASMNEALQSVEFLDGWDTQLFVKDPQTGFFAERPELNGDTRLYLGFIGTYRDGSEEFGGVEKDESGALHAVTQLEAVPPSFRTVNWQGKGVGARLWNMPEGSMGMPLAPQKIEAFVTRIKAEGIHDMRDASDPVEIMRQIRRHIVARKPQGSLDEAIAELHASYGDADAVLRRMPLQARVRMQERLPHVSWRQRPSFMLMRKPLQLQRVGHVSLPGFPY